MEYIRAHSREELLGELLEIATDLTMIRDVETLLQAIVRRTRRLLGVDMAYVSLTDFESGQTTIEQTDGVVTAEYRSLVQPLGTGVLGQIAMGLAPYQTTDYLRDRSLNRIDEIDEIVRGEGVRAIMGVPLKVGGKVIGALVVAERTPREFTPEEIDIVDSIGKHAAVALDNSMRFERMDAIAEHLSGEQQRSAEALGMITQVLELDARLMEAVMVAPDIRRILGVGGTVISGELGFESDAGAWVWAGERESVRKGQAELRAHIVVSAAGERLGVVGSTNELSAAETRLLERVAVHVALAIQFIRAERDADARRQADFLEEVLAGRLEAIDRAPLMFQRWGLRPGEVMTCVQLAAPLRERWRDPQLFESLHPGSVMMAHADHVCLVTSLSDWETRVRHIFARQEWRLQAGASRPIYHPRDLAQAHRSAQFALGSLIAVDREGVVDASELGVLSAVLELARRDALPAEITAAIEPLIEYDRARGASLTQTAMVYLETDASVARTAELMVLHRNTVRQRLERIAGLLGEDWQRSPRRLEIHLALKAHAEVTGH